MDNPSIPPAPNSTPDTVPAKPVYLWDTPANARYSVRLICDEEGLTVDQKNDLSRTVNCESGNYNIHTVHPNLGPNGQVSTTDYGIAQINDYWHIGPGKDFASKEAVLGDPEADIRWMCRMWKAGHGKMWVCYSKGLYKHYQP